MAFNDELKKLRIERGFTQEKLAENLRIAKSTISMYECGNRQPDFETLEAIADFFNVDMNKLMGHTLNELSDDRTQGYYLNPETAALAQEMFDNPDLRILFDASRKATPEDLRKIKEMALIITGNDDEEPAG